MHRLIYGVDSEQHIGGDVVSAHCAVHWELRVDIPESEQNLLICERMGHIVSIWHDGWV